MLRNLLRETVFMRIVLAYILGIIAYKIVDSNFSILIAFILFLIYITILLSFKLIILNRYNVTFKFYNGLIVYLLCFSSAYFICYTKDYRNSNAYHKLLSEKSIRVEINSEGKKGTNRCSYEAHILYGKFEFNTILSITDTILRYKVGDILQIKKSVAYIDEVKQIGQFDYKNYLCNKRILHQLRCKQNEIVVIKINDSFSLKSISIECKNKLLLILKKNIKELDIYNMAAALLLGERTSIDDSTMNDYKNTGTIHIISVSGLHVGIIFIVLQYIFKIIPYVKRSKYLNCILIIICIWFYSLLTGLPSSVIRSATMISFVIFGKVINVKTNPVNHVAASALFMLSIEPYYLFDVGFQLSYLAVLGILYLQKPIQNLYVPKYKITEYIWIMSSVSIAAQLFTLPLCLFYFHQFPNYFLLANLIAIPLSSIALYTSIANLIFSYIPYLDYLSELTLTYSISLMNYYLKFVANIPGSVSKFEQFNMFETIMITLFLFFFLLYAQEKIKSSFKYAILCLIILISYQIINQYKHQHLHYFELKKRNYSLKTIESNDSLIHLIQLNTKHAEIKSYLKNWKNYSNKAQKVIFLKNQNYGIYLSGSIKFKTPVNISNAERVCM